MEKLPATSDQVSVEVEGDSVSTSGGPDPLTARNPLPSAISHPIRPTAIIAPSTIRNPNPPSGEEIPPTRGYASSATSGDEFLPARGVISSTSGDQIILQSATPLMSDGRNKDSSETDTADESGSSSDTAFSGDEQELLRKRPRYSSDSSENGVSVPPTSGEQVSSESSRKSAGRNKDSSEADTEDDSGSSTDTAPSPSDDEQPRKRPRFANVLYDPTRTYQVSSTSSALVSSEIVELQKTKKENVDSRCIDISDNSNSPSSLSSDEHEQLSRDSVPSTNDNLFIAKTEGSIPSTSGQSVRPKSRDPILSTSGQSVRPKTRGQISTTGKSVRAKISDPVSSTSGQLVRPKIRDPVPSTSDQSVRQKIRDSVPSTSGQWVLPKRRDPVPSTRGQSVQQKISDPVSSTSGQSVQPKISDPVPLTSGQSVPSTSGQSVRTKKSDPVPSTSNQSVRPKISNLIRSTSGQNTSFSCDEGSEERPREFPELTRLLEQYHQPKKGDRVVKSLYIPEDRGDSFEDSPDEEIHSRVTKIERDLDRDAMMERVRKALHDSRAAIEECELHKGNAVWLKENSYEKMKKCQESIVCLEIGSLQLVHSHIRLYRMVFRRWDVVYQKLVERINAAKDLRKCLKKRLGTMAGERMNFNAAQNIYDAIDDLNGLLKYSEALLRCVMQRGDFLNTIKNKMKSMTD